MLYCAHKENPEKYLEVWRFIGEIYIKELNHYGFMSYTCVHRTFELFDENTGLIERRKVMGKSGARYYEYRISPSVTVALIKDTALLGFYQRIKKLQNEANTSNTG